MLGTRARDATCGCYLVVDCPHTYNIYQRSQVALFTRGIYVFHKKLLFMVTLRWNMFLQWKRHISYVEAGRGQVGACWIWYQMRCETQRITGHEAVMGDTRRAQRSGIYTEEHHYSQNRSLGTCSCFCAFDTQAVWPMPPNPQASTSDGCAHYMWGKIIISSTLNKAILGVGW